MTTLVTTSNTSVTSNTFTNPHDLDDLDARGSIDTGRTRLRALWTVWSVEVRVLSGALESPAQRAVAQRSPLAAFVVSVGERGSGDGSRRASLLAGSGGSERDSGPMELEQRMRPVRAASYTHAREAVFRCGCRCSCSSGTERGCERGSLAGHGWPAKSARTERNGSLLGPRRFTRAELTRRGPSKRPRPRRVHSTASHRKGGPLVGRRGVARSGEHAVLVAVDVDATLTGEPGEGHATVSGEADRE